MKKSERLEPIKQIAANHEQDAATELGKSQRALNEHEQKLEQLINYRGEYAKLFHAHGSRGMDGSQLQAYQTFIGQLDIAIKQQREMIIRANNERDVKREEWKVRHTRTQALDKTVDRMKQTERKADDTKEQKELDDINNARFWQNKQK